MNLPPDDPTGPAEQAPRPVDRALLDRIFGDVLPDTTADERDPGGGGAGDPDDWYRENRPPHHGG